MKNIIYFGHGLAGYYGLTRLMRGELKNEIDIKLVITSNNGGEKAELVNNLAKEYDLNVFFEKMSSPELLEMISKCNPDLGVVMNFDQRIPTEVVDSIPSGIWNVHPSDLPKHRGGAPLEYMIVNGDDLRISVHEVQEKFDSGNVIYKSQSIPIWDMDIDELYFFSSKQSALALEESLKLFISGDYNATPQDNSSVSYAKPSGLKKLLRINWQKDDGELIYRKVLAGGVNRGAVSGVKLDSELILFGITEANFYPGKNNPENYGKISHPLTGGYHVDVIGGKLHFSDVNCKINDKVSDVIYALNKASSEGLTLC